MTRKELVGWLFACAMAGCFTCCVAGCGDDRPITCETSGGKYEYDHRSCHWIGKMYTCHDVRECHFRWFK